MLFILSRIEPEGGYFFPSIATSPKIDFGALHFSSSDSFLSQITPELIPYVLGTQIVTNIASGIYEQRRSAKKKAKEKIELIKIREKCFKGNDCRTCDNLNCPYCRPIKKSEEVEEEEYNPY